MPSTLTVELDEMFSDPASRTYEKTATYRKSIDREKTFVDCKAETPASKNGSIEGYGSVWNVVDHQGELVRKGAFTKTIAERGGKIPLMVVHFAKGGDIMQAVGAITELVEDDYGLRFKAEWFSDPFSQSVRQKVIELRAKNVKIGTSIGYRVIAYGFIKDEVSDKTVVELRELALGELTVTLKPALDPAVVTGAKTDDERSNLLAPFAPIVEAKDLDNEGRKQLVEQLGGAEAVESLGKALKGIADKTLGLLAAKSQDADPKDGDTKSADTPPKNGADAGGSSSTKGKVDLHSARKAVEKARLMAIKASQL